MCSKLIRIILYSLKFNVIKFANKFDNMAVKRYFDLPST